jgi:hypothetical protein
VLTALLLVLPFLIFDGASNVQKAGKILETKFPRSYTLHGGEHVVALFFSDIAKIFEIKVMYWFLINYCCIVFLKYLCHWQTGTSPEGLSPVQHIWIRSHSQYLCPVHGTIQYSVFYEGLPHALPLGSMQ